MAILGLLGFAVIVVAGYFGHVLNDAASEQRRANALYSDIVAMRDRGREAEILQWKALVDRGRPIAPELGLRVNALTAEARDMMRRQRTVDPDSADAAQAAEQTVAGLSRLQDLLVGYLTAETPAQRRAIMDGSFDDVSATTAAMGRWVTARGAASQRATTHFERTARRLSAMLIGVVSAVLLVGFALWLRLEKARERVLLHVDRAGHEQAGLRRVAELVAAEEDERSVLSAVAQEMVALTGAGGAWVVRIEGRLAFVHGAAMESAPLRLRLDGVTRFPIAHGGALERALATGAPAFGEDGGGPGPEERRLRELGARVAIAAPIVASGRTWGAVLALGTRADRLRRGSEDNLLPFARLAGLAITGAEGRRVLTERAETDALTGLPNHAAFHQRLAQTTSQAGQDGGEAAVVLSDLDLLTEVNVRDGHHEGDRVLAAVARRLAPLTPPGGMLARVGGEEFGWLVPGMTQQAAMQLAERARRAVSAAPVGTNRVTISVGVATLGLVGDRTPLFAGADAALQVAKAKGRDTVVAFAPEFLTSEARQMRQRQIERTRTLSAVRALARAVDARDPATQRHSERVAAMTYRIARLAGWTEERAELAREAALVHDVGKIGVPDHVLRKAGALTDEEFALIATHAELGATIVADVLTPEQTGWVRHHHERTDGRGYPDGLAGDDIPEGARIMAIADAWDAMTADRPYRRALTIDAAIAECRFAAGSQLDERLVALATPTLPQTLSDHETDFSGQLPG